MIQSLEVVEVALRNIYKILPYFIVKKLAKKYCERVNYSGTVIEVFEGEGIVCKEYLKKDEKTK
jgi:hypothetical protein